MTTSRRLAERKVVRFDKNITKRGTVPETTAKKGNNYPVGPILLGFFVFVVIGSFCILHGSRFIQHGNCYDYMDSCYLLFLSPMLDNRQLGQGHS
ncbi:hypothetical protein RHGRI_034149 [Rhododendron griersonianum]|uniref:Ribosome associated membrane protein RAMP4 n=1 Tax=Rhododendron griersonianum TaxID=479676 RepID=A0AAV6HZD5_9ERIC|nr:hypothetical protein RHGRI_034149 [Rhododendron griersonianum]